MRRRLDIQGLRAIAVISVVVFHAGLPLESGFLGVDIFFAISGFVIIGVLSRANGNIKTIFSNFYVRRFRRLVPALSILLFTTVVLSLFIFAPFEAQKQTAQTAIGASFGIANAVISLTTGGYFDLAATTNPLLHTWSLAVEEQFYLLFPALLFLSFGIVKKRFSKHAAFLFLTVALSLLSLALMVASHSEWQNHIPSITKGFYSPFPRMWEFGFGAFAYLISVKITRVNPRLNSVLSILGIALLVTAFITTSEQTQTPGIQTVIPILGVSMVMFAGSNSHNNFVNKALQAKPLVFIGDISYSLYLWHWPLIVFSAMLWPSFPYTMTFAALLAFIPAVLSYSFVEQKLTKPWVMKSVLKKAGLAIAFVVIPVLTASTLLYANQHNFWNSTIGNIKIQMDQPHLGDSNGCVSLVVPSGSPSSNCIFGVTDSSLPPIYLVGDSHADQFSESLEEVALKQNTSLVVSTTNGCPFIPLFVHRPELGEAWQADCYANATGKLEWLKSQPPGIVVISNSGVYFNSMDISLTPESPAQPQSKNLSLYKGALTNEVLQLEASGHTVVLASPTPQHLQSPTWPQNCPIPSLITNWCTQTTNFEDANSSIKSVEVVTRRVSKELGVKYVDVSSQLCPSQLCSTITEQQVNFRNPDHITVAFATKLGQWFIDELGASFKKDERKLQ